MRCQMLKIAIVSISYGKEINGGSQQYAKLIAEKLTKYFDVDVLTTKAVDSWSWKDYYLVDNEIINGVNVHRFSVDKERTQVFIDIQKKYLEDEPFEEQWINNVGPKSNSLIDYAIAHKNDYKAFIIVTYEYYFAVRLIPLLRDKVIFIPTAHDCKLIRRKLFSKLFLMPGAFIYLTEEEKKLCNKLFHNAYINSEVAGVGIDIPGNVDGEKFVKSHNLSNYILYVGRIEEGKGCLTLFRDFEKYKKECKNDLKLVLMGKSSMKIPADSDIINLGFVSDEEKFSGMKMAKFLVLPSEYESLSMVVLEAMACSTPVLVNSKCNVLKGHCLKSNGGFYYKSYDEFKKILEFTWAHPNIYRILKTNSEEYIRKNYCWPAIIKKFCSLINDI